MVTTGSDHTKAATRLQGTSEAGIEGALEVARAFPGFRVMQ
jgi:hypothetical protein